MTTQTGTIVSVNDRGFGFISRNGDKDIYFHCTDLDDTLPFDQTLRERRVEFNVIDTPKGQQAKAVRAVE